MSNQLFETLPNSVIIIGDVQKINQIVNYFADHLIVILFSSPHCGPCKAFLPILEKAQQEFYTDQVVFLKINTIDLPQVAQQFNVMGTPTTIFIKHKKGKKRVTGFMSLAKLRDTIFSVINS